MMVEDRQPNWLHVVLRGGAGPKPPPLGSERIKALAGRGLLTPRSLTEIEIQEMAASIISHLVETKDR